MVHVFLVHPAGEFAVSGGAHLLHRHTGQDVHRHAASAQHEVMLGQDVVESVQAHGQDVHVQGLGQGEGSFVEASYLSVAGAGAFREDDDAVSAPHQVLQMGEIAVVAVGDGTELRRVDDHAVVGVTPHPVVGQDDDAGRQLHQGHQVQVRLVVADDDGGPAEGLVFAAPLPETHAGHAADDETGDALQQPVIEGLTVPPPLQRAVYQHRIGYQQQEHTAQEARHRDGRCRQAAQGDGIFAPSAMLLRQPSEHHRRQPAGHHHHHGHTHDGYFGQRPQGRMPADNQRAYADEHDNGGQDHAAPAGLQAAPARSVLGHQALGDENGIVISLAEDESGQNDIDDVELEAQQLHEPQYPHPTHSQRQEGHQAHLHTAQRQPQEGKDHEAADETDIVKRGRQGLGQMVADVFLREYEATGRQGGCDTLLDAAGGTPLHPDEVHYPASSVRRMHHELPAHLFIQRGFLPWSGGGGSGCAPYLVGKGTEGPGCEAGLRRGTFQGSSSPFMPLPESVPTGHALPTQTV